MEDKTYILRILPLFEEDLQGIVDHIVFEFKNPEAAGNLIDAVEAAINERLSCPEAFEPYASKKERRYPYYRIYVKNYTIFYVVIGNIMEVRRILYSKRDLLKHI